MTEVLARIVLSIAMLLHGVGGIASEIDVASHPHCHAASHHSAGEQGRQGKMPCCHCDECTVPACASGCAVQALAFIVRADIVQAAYERHAAANVMRASRVVCIDTNPPLRPPIV